MLCFLLPPPALHSEPQHKTTLLSSPGSSSSKQKAQTCPTLLAVCTNALGDDPVKGTKRTGSFLLLFQTKPGICRAKSLPAASKTRKQRLCCASSWQTTARGHSAPLRGTQRGRVVQQLGAQHSKVSAFRIFSLPRTATISPGETLDPHAGPQADFGAASPRGAVAAARAAVCPDTNPDRAALKGRKRRPVNSQD